MRVSDVVPIHELGSQKLAKTAPLLLRCRKVTEDPMIIKKHRPYAATQTRSESNLSSCRIASIDPAFNHKGRNGKCSGDTDPQRSVRDQIQQAVPALRPSNPTTHRAPIIPHTARIALVGRPNEARDRAAWRAWHLLHVHRWSMNRARGRVRRSVGVRGRDSSR